MILNTVCFAQRPARSDSAESVERNICAVSVAEPHAVFLKLFVKSEDFSWQLSLKAVES